MKMPLVLAGPVLASLAAMCLCAAAEAAEEAPKPWRGFYLGGGGSYSTVSVDVAGGNCYDECYWWGDYNDYDQGDGAFGYALHAGLRVHEYVAFEVNYIDTGNISWDENVVYMPEFKDYYNNRVDFSAKVTEVSILGILPFEPWEAYLRLGAGFWDGKSQQRLDQSFGTAVVTRDVEDNGTGLLVGIGFGVTVAKSWHLRLDLQTVGIDEDVLNAQNDTTLDSLLFEVQYRFGAH